AVDPGRLSAPALRGGSRGRGCSPPPAPPPRGAPGGARRRCRARKRRRADARELSVNCCESVQPGRKGARCDSTKWKEGGGLAAILRRREGGSGEGDSSEWRRADRRPCLPW